MKKLNDEIGWMLVRCNKCNKIIGIIGTENDTGKEKIHDHELVKRINDNGDIFELYCAECFLSLLKKGINDEEKI